MKKAISFKISLLVISFLISFLFQSCKSRLEKLNIDDIKGHETYQDDVLKKAKNFTDSIIKINDLIGEYLSLKSETDLTKTSNYNYYLSRLYGQIYWIPFSRLYDSSSKKIINPVLYKNYYDSTFFYAQKSLSIDSSNIRAMYLLCINFYDERNRFLYDKENIPFSGLVNSELWNQRNSYIINNALRFTEMKYNENDSLSRCIAEIALNSILMFFDGDYVFDRSDRNKTNNLYVSGKLYRYLKKFDQFLVINFDKKLFEKEFLSNVKLAEEEIAIMPLYDYFYDKSGKILGQVGWECTSHSIEEDIKQNGIGKPVYYPNPSIKESEIIIKLYYDKTYSFTFKPVYCSQNIILNGSWNFDINNSELILDNDLFAKANVYSMDLEGNVDEYYFVSKRIKFDGSKLILDVRSTNRLTYILYLADKNNGESDEFINEQTFDKLKNLSLPENYISQYLKYFHY
jgi:hypothetical protein